MQCEWSIKWEENSNVLGSNPSGGEKEKHLMISSIYLVLVFKITKVALLDRIIGMDENIYIPTQYFTTLSVLSAIT